jgi:chorismate dehydratase
MLRVGTVPYLVARPLDSGLEDERDIELVRDVPARLVAALRAKELDVALVSSIELFRRSGYTWLDGLGVAGRGPVSSVQVFLRRPLPEVRTLALDPASRAAAALTQIVWPQGSGARTRFLTVAPDEDPAETGADAWLRIGDAALRAALAPDAPPTFDPAATWTEGTGLPFVFAVWIARPGVDLAPYAPAFLRSRRRGAECAEDLARVASEEWSLPLDATRRYLLEECVFEPGTDAAPALSAFRDAAAKRDLCRGDLYPRAIQVPQQ